ncbi:TPA: hypothetical protein TZY53_000683 [Streptococcus suis]|nr:hypothetical protein [Streptococcus suis]
MIPKFRAWVEAEETMHPVLSLDWSGIDDNLTVFVPMGHTSSRAVSIDNAILMQSTGLFDKNGKEIFEGDVVLANGWRKVAVSFGTQEIEENFGDKRIFQGFNLCLGGGYPDAVMSDFEVIGNIYKNPELVEGNND